MLLAADTDLSAGTSWAGAGYAVVPSLPPPLLLQLQAGLAALLRTALRAAGCPVASGYDITQSSAP